MNYLLELKKSSDVNKLNRSSWFNCELDKHNFSDLDKNILNKDFEKINQIADEVIEELKKTYHHVYIDMMFFINELCKMRNIQFKNYKTIRLFKKRNMQEQLWIYVLNKLKYDKDQKAYNKQKIKDNIKNHNINDDINGYFEDNKSGNTFFILK